jgi:uncharacterized protein YidB (DUF937 family)
MGILDALRGVEGQSDTGQNAGAGGTKATVASGLMQALDEHPGGLAGVLDHFRQNGMEQHVQNWATGQQTSATPEQIQQGLGNSGFIDRVAGRAGVSPETAKVALAAILPVVVAHFTKGGQQPAPQSGFGGMASQVISRFL